MIAYEATHFICILRFSAGYKVPVGHFYSVATDPSKNKNVARKIAVKFIYHLHKKPEPIKAANLQPLRSEASASRKTIASTVKRCYNAPQFNANSNITRSINASQKESKNWQVSKFDGSYLVL